MAAQVLDSPELLIMAALRDDLVSLSLTSLSPSLSFLFADFLSSPLLVIIPYYCLIFSYKVIIEKNRRITSYLHE